jgi:uncharacterized protein (TIGR03000 family)
MYLQRLSLSLGLFLFACGLVSQAQEPKAAEAKKPATIKVLVPEPNYKSTELKIEDLVTKQKGETRTFTTPPLEGGKTYVYKIEITVEPNNYTKIIRKREVSFKAGEEVSLDLRNKDEKFPDDVRIRWVPTPKDIVIKMGELAKIGKDEIVYDLGCGDGIMIITAVKEMGAKKGIGIDIDAKKVVEAKDNAKQAGISDKIEIREGNILTLEAKDIGDANVVMLYLGDEMLARLKPMLQKALKPGTRIVSHRFVMGDDWKPEKTVKVQGEDGDEYELHLWTITGKEGKK